MTRISAPHPRKRKMLKNCGLRRCQTLSPKSNMDITSNLVAIRTDEKIYRSAAISKSYRGEKLDYAEAAQWPQHLQKHLGISWNYSAVHISISMKSRDLGSQCKWKILSTCIFTLFSAVWKIVLCRTVLQRGSTVPCYLLTQFWTFPLVLNWMEWIR